jgi:hexosaminidase
MKNIYLSNFALASILICLFLFPSCRKTGDNPQAQTGHVHGIIPLPQNVDLNEGNLVIDKNVVLVNNTEFQPAVSVVENALEQAFASAITKYNSPVGKINIQFTVDNTLDTSAYQIDITAKGIIIKAKTPMGAFYAAQSIRQMIWNSTSGLKSQSFSFRLMTIKDKPQYAWRGFHLDVSRHFFTKEYILKIIYWLAYYKFDKLHLHLSDDQGWRIQIDQFPKLTEIGAWRTFNKYDSTCMELAKMDNNYAIDKRFIKEVNGQTFYGGFYTKQDIRDIIAYASAHYIDIIPEIDMPGHMSAAIRAYPQLSCVDSAGWGTEFSFPICPCNDPVMDFSYKVWDEIAELFPSKVVHIGCDEVEKGTWASSPACQAFMKQNGMTSLNEIQNYFVKKIQEHLQAKGKTVVAWDDVIDGNIDNKITMMFWRDWVTDSPARSAANGNPIIISDWSCFYLSSNGTDESLRKLYDYNPANKYPATVLSKIQGMQGCVWTEEIPSEAAFELHVFPGLEALAEVCWASGRDWYSFQARMQPHFSYLSLNKINYRRPAWMY